MDHRVAVEEGPAPGVFAGQTHRNTFIDQRGVGEVFRAAPVEQLLAGGHCLTIAIDFRDARLHLNGFRHSTDAFRQLLQTLRFNFVRIALIPLVVEVRGPGKGVHVHRTPLLHHAFAGIQRVAVEVNLLGSVFQRRDLISFQLVSVDFARGRMLFDFLIHQRLGCARLVGFVVAVTAVAHQIDEDIAFEGITEIQRQAGHESDRFRVIGVDVENRRLHHLTDVGAVRGRTRIQRVRRGESHLVVNHDAYGTAHFVTARFGHVQGFLNHALAGDRGVAVNGDRQNFVAARFVETIEASTYGADNHRADDFQVRRVKRQRQVHQAAFGFHVGREAHVVLHVTGTEVFFMFTGKFVEQVLRFFTQHVDQYVQTTAVRHAQHHFAGAALTRVADNLFEHRDQRIAAFQREAFCAREFRPEVAFEAFRRGQLAQEAFFLFGAKARFACYRLDTLLDPAFFFGRSNVHIFRADGAAIGLLQGRDQIAQLHRVFTDGKRTYVIDLLEIGLGQIVVSRIEIRHSLLLPQSQRIEIRMLVTTEAVCVDELQDFNLLHIGVRVGNRRSVTRGILRQAAEIITRFGMKLIRFDSGAR